MIEEDLLHDAITLDHVNQIFDVQVSLKLFLAFFVEVLGSLNVRLAGSSKRGLLVAAKALEPDLEER